MLSSILSLGLVPRELLVLSLAAVSLGLLILLQMQTFVITLASFYSFERDREVWQRAQQRLKAAYEQTDGSRLVMKSKDPLDKETFATWEWDVDPLSKETKERNAWIRLRKLRGEVFELPTMVAIMSTNIVG